MNIRHISETEEWADLDSFLDSVLEEGLAAIGAKQGSLMLLNAREKILEIIERRGPLFDPKRKHRRFKVGEGIAGWVAENCRPYLSADVSRESSLFKQPVGALNFRSLLAVPIGRSSRAIGVICADSPEFNKFSQRDIETLTQLAQRVADKIDQLAVDTFISYKKRLKQLEALHEVGQELSRLMFDSPEELTKLLDQISKDAARVLEADLVTLYQYDENSRRFQTPPTRSGDFRHPEWMITPVSPGDAPARIVKERTPRYSEKAPTDSVMRAGEIVPASGDLPDRPSFVDREGVLSSAGIPLRAGQEIVGVMFINYRAQHPFPEGEKSVIETLAAYAALAIQGARRLHKMIPRARQEALQRSSQMVAHRLRNVLPVISERLDRLIPLNVGDALDWCRTALSETRRAQKIVREFENFSRAEPYQRSDTLSAADLANRLAEEARQSTAEVGANVTVQVPAQYPTVIVNLGRLRDDFANFARDSMRHKPQGLRLVIACALATEADVKRVGLSPNESYVKMSYCDNGPGIPEDGKQRVFEPFYTTTQGSGLGLAIAAHNARVHGGVLIENGSQNGGVHFELYLPVAFAASSQNHSI